MNLYEKDDYAVQAVQTDFQQDRCGVWKVDRRRHKEIKEDTLLWKTWLKEWKDGILKCYELVKRSEKQYGRLFEREQISRRNKSKDGGTQ